MKTISKGTADFEKIRMDNAIYVDKTEYLWSLLQNISTSQFFLARPRRFGKSLTLSTLKAIFQGRKELFDGLAISRHEYSWEKYPVIHLSFGDYGATGTTEELTRDYIIKKLQEIAKENGVRFNESNKMPRDFFIDLISKMGGQKNVVILIDEYDKIITDNIGRDDILNYRGILADFYSVLKEYESKIRFLFMTGVTRFSQVSLFSKLNNLTDVSRDVNYATMLGYTQEELDTCFADYLELAAQKHKTDVPGITAKIKCWYDGFRFHQDAQTVYNPVSIGLFLTGNFEFQNYWFNTATPGMLFKCASDHNTNILEAMKMEYDDTIFSAFDVEDIDPVVLLNQTGYLTIAGARATEDGMLFRFDFPNKEVRNSFQKHLLGYYIGKTQSGVRGLVYYLKEAVSAGNVDRVVQLVNVHLAGIPNRIKLNDEKYFQSMFYSLFAVLGYEITAESSTYDGYIDAAIICGDWCFIFEFKLDLSAEVAMEQIKAKEYYRKYLNVPQKIMLVGANFDSEKGMLTNIQTELVEK